MGEGTRSSPPPEPGAPLLSASFRAGPPGSRAALGSLPFSGLLCGRGSCLSVRRGGLGRGEERAGTRRGEERQKGEEKRGVCRGKAGWGRLCQFNPEGVSFIYLFFKKFVMSHITQTYPRRGGSGWGVREGV